MTAARGTRAVLVLLALSAFVAVGAVGCASSTTNAVAGETGTPRETTLTVFAAASLHDALGAATKAYESANPGVHVVVSTGASSALATQLEQGARADVFLAADTASPARLAADALLAGAPAPFATNVLAIVVPPGNPAAISTPLDLARSGVKIVTAAPAVPIARYAAQLAANLARQPGYPADFLARYEANVVSREDDVEAIVTKVALGEADAGVVYATDAAARRGTLGTVAIPAAANVAATYAGAVLKESPNLPAATAFLEWVSRGDGQAVLRSYGFGQP